MNWMNIFSGALFVGLGILWVYMIIRNKDMSGSMTTVNDTLAAA